MSKTVWSLLFFFVLLSCATPAKKPFPGLTVRTTIPDGPAGEQLAWFVEQNNRPTPPTSEEVIQHFHQNYISLSSAELTAQRLERWAMRPMQFKLSSVRYQNYWFYPGPLEQIEGFDERRDHPTTVTIVIDTPTGKIYQLEYSPMYVFGKVPKNYDEAERSLRAIAPKTQLLIAEVKDKTCRPIHRWNSDEPLAMGSSSQLFTLLALTQHLKWEDTLWVQDKWKSPETANFQEIFKEQHSVKVFAEKMISFGNNTASDHLIRRIGRENIENLLPYDMTRNRPFLMAREELILKLQDKHRQAFLELDENGRRSYLALELSTETFNEDEPLHWRKPLFIDQIGWFASSESLCGVLANLQDSQDARDVLAVNPGPTGEQKQFRYVGYKGHFETGIYSMNWLVQKADRRWFVVSLAANDPNHPLKSDDITRIAAGVLDTLATDAFPP